MIGYLILLRGVGVTDPHGFWLPDPVTQSLKMLNAVLRRRKGRGFEGSGTDREEGDYDRIDEIEEGNPGPQRSIEVSIYCRESIFFD
jgi:hypothetical protein